MVLLTRKNVEDDALCQATVLTPFAIFDTPEGTKGVFLLDDNIARAFLLSEVERKKREMASKGKNVSSSTGSQSADEDENIF